MSHERACNVCQIIWDISDLMTEGERQCPKCGAPAFWTSNAGDIGQAMYMRENGLTFADYEKHKGGFEQ